MKPEVISREQAPVKEVVVTGDRIDLKAYPALVHHYMDPGSYFTSAYLTTYDPDTGIDMTSSTKRRSSGPWPPGPSGTKT